MKVELNMGGIEGFCYGFVSRRQKNVTVALKPYVAAAPSPGGIQRVLVMQMQADSYRGEGYQSPLSWEFRLNTFS
jgi:hypothetical protein